MKRIGRVFLILLILVTVIMSSCCDASREPAPEMDEVYARLVQVIAASHEVNVLLFGAGLPVYP